MNKKFPQKKQKNKKTMNQKEKSPKRKSYVRTKEKKKAKRVHFHMIIPETINNS